MENVTRPSRKAGQGINSKKISAELPLPEPGQTVTMEIPRYNLTILIERGAAETQEQLRERYTVVSPIAPDRRLHAARLGVGAIRAKRFSITLCSQEATPDKQLKSGPRVDIALDTVTCQACVKIMREEGIEIGEAGA